MNIFDKIKKLPDNPGVYLFYNFKKELIYVGKATSLKNRVRSYFVGARTSRPIEQMIHEVVDIKTIQTDSVLEAIILEANYIKKFQPKYNVDLKDDKSWNYIVITKDVYPQVLVIRQHELDNVKLKIKNFKFNFGPYPGLKTREMMKLLQKLFFISTCRPPVRHVERRLKAEVETSRGSKRSFVNAQDDGIRPCLYYQMGQCLGVCTGEISPVEYKKKVINPLVKFLRGNKKSLVKDLEKKMKEESKQENFEEATRLRNQIQALQRIQDIALLNKNFIEDQKLKIKNFKLKIRVEGYDISNLGSIGKVGSMVVFENGEPKKSAYRKFKIKTVTGQSDVDCLAEVLERRLKHVIPAPACNAMLSIAGRKTGISEKNKTPAFAGVTDFWPMPDVILVDGGATQVNRAVETIRINKFKIPVIGIAKGSERKRNDFIIGFKDKNFIKWVSENRGLLIRVRDEAHRFAIQYQKSLRKIK